VVNFFSLGNSTLHQTNRFQAEIWGILGSTLFMLINTFWTIEFFTPEQAPLIVILGYVGGRCIFWVITDLWADYRIFRWKGSSIKIRSLLAISISLPLIISLKRVGENYYLFSALAGLILFFGIFRLLGGVGKQTRNSVSKILGPKFRIILYFI
jgi:hypothetical protein